MHFKVRAFGFESLYNSHHVSKGNFPKKGLLGVFKDGKLLASGEGHNPSNKPPRGWNIALLNRSNGSLHRFQSFDVYGAG